MISRVWEFRLIYLAVNGVVEGKERRDADIRRVSLIGRYLSTAAGLSVDLSPARFL